MKRVDNDSEMIVRRHNHGLELRSVKHSTILAVYQTHAHYKGKKERIGMGSKGMYDGRKGQQQLSRDAMALIEPYDAIRRE